MTTFTGPIKSKALDTDARTGEVVLVQRATIAAVNSAGNPITFSLPNPSDVVDFKVSVEIPFAAGALVTAVNIEVSGAGGSTIVTIPVSASGMYGISDRATGVGAATSWRNVSVDVEAHASVQALATALTIGQGIASIMYIDRTSAAGL